VSIHTTSSEQLDEDLVLRVQLGDKSAFDFLVIKCQHKIIQLVNLYVKDPSEAQVVAQESFIKAYRSLGNFRGNSAFYTWLYRIAINTAKDYLVSRSRRSSDYQIPYLPMLSMLVSGDFMLKKFGWCVFLVFLFNQNGLAQLPDFTEMVKVNGVAVVNISTIQKAKPETAEGAQQEIPMPEGMPPEMEELFNIILITQRVVTMGVEIRSHWDPVLLSPKMAIY